MVKTVKKKTTAETKKQKAIIPEKYQDYIFIFFIILAVFVFLWEAITGGGFNEADSLSSMSFDNFKKEASNAGTFPLWIPYIFGGMPSFASLLTQGQRLWDFFPQIFFGITEFIGNLFSSDVARMAAHYSIYGIGMYFLLRSKELDRFQSFFAAIAAIFSTWVITWVMIGHNTKPVVLSMFPFILMFIEKLRVKFSIIYLALLILVVHFMMEAGHLQLIFYGVCAFGIFLIFEFVHRAITKAEPINVLRSAGLLIVAGLIAFGMSSDRYLSTVEYTPYSTRGSAPIEQPEGKKVDASGGNEYNYATAWSYSPKELITFVNPSYFGFGQREVKLMATGNEPVMLSTYWGQKESEDSPPYMGIMVLLLAILGIIFFRKDPFIWALVVISVFSIFLSFGKNLSFLYDLFYYFVPSFNKFRAPSMSLVLLHFAVPILSGYGIAGVINWQKNFQAKDKSKLNIILIIAIAFLVIGFIFSATFKTSYLNAATDKLSKIYGTNLPGEFFDAVWNFTVGDWYFVGFLLLAGAVSIYLFITGKIKRFLFYLILISILFIDLWRIDTRRMQVSETDLTTVFTDRRDIYDFIKQDKSIYRIADYSTNIANLPAWFLMENINGYHAAKLRVYQDLMDFANSPQFAKSTSQLFNPFLWNLMNVKYIITSQSLGEGIQPIYQSQKNRALVYLNNTALNRVFFVKNAAVEKPREIIRNLEKGNFNPLDTAFVEKRLPSTIEMPDSTAYAKIIEKKNEYIKIEANASGNNLLFNGEIFYPVSWKGFIDGKETEIYKTNYAFRSVIVPKGKHIIEMKFESKNFEIGKTFSIILNIFVLALLVFGLIYENKKQKRRTDTKQSD
jgi:hypothetical protein